MYQFEIKSNETNFITKFPSLNIRRGKNQKGKKKKKNGIVI